MTDVETTPLVHEYSSAEHGEDDHLQHAKAVRAIENDISPETSSLGRKIGWSSAYIMVISRVIGSGIFAMPGSIVQTVGSPGLALTLWVLGAAAAWCGLAIDMEYGCMLPRSGGVKVYLEYTYRRPQFLASTLVAAQALLLGFTATNCIVFAKYTIFAFGLQPTDLTTKLLAVGSLTVITIVHACFRKKGILIQNILGCIKVMLIAFTGLIGIVVLFRRTRGQDTTADGASWDYLWKDSNWEWNNLSTAFFKILYSYAGLSNINNVLNEVKNPIRTVKSVGPVALLTACIMYVLINVAYLSMVPLEEIRRSRELIAALFFERLGFGKAFLPIGIALSAVGNVMVVTFSLARVNQEVARQGFLPFSKLLASNAPFNAPMGGLIVHYIPSALAIVFPPSNTVYAFIADTEEYAGQFFAFAVAAGLIILRIQKPELSRPYKAWLPAVWLRIILCVFLIVAPIFPPKKGNSDVNFFYATYALVGISIILFSILYWFIWTVALPRYRGYVLEEEVGILDDGTSITRLVRKIK